MSEGTDKLIKRILADAEAEAQRIKDEAEAEALAVTEDAKKRVAEVKSEGDEACRHAENEMLFLAKKSAELEAKKTDLAYRHRVIDEAFSETLTKLRAMNATQTAELLKKVLFRETSGGETIHPAKSNAGIIEGILSEINSMLKKEGSNPLTLGEATDEITDGFIAVGEGYVKKCSYEALLADLKEREIGQIADILF